MVVENNLHLELLFLIDATDVAFHANLLARLSLVLRRLAIILLLAVLVLLLPDRLVVGVIGGWRIVEVFGWYLRPGLHASVLSHLVKLIMRVLIVLTVVLEHAARGIDQVFLSRYLIGSKCFGILCRCLLRHTY